VTAHHRFIIDLSLGHMQYIEQQILRLDEEIARHLEPYQKQFQLLQTIPGIGPNASAAVLAEIGPDVSPFDDDGKLASWSGICPGNNESGGKKFSSNTRKGNPHLVSTLVKAPGHPPTRKTASSKTATIVFARGEVPSAPSWVLRMRCCERFTLSSKPVSRIKNPFAPC